MLTEVTFEVLCQTDVLKLALLLVLLEIFQGKGIQAEVLILINQALHYGHIYEGTSDLIGIHAEGAQEPAHIVLDVGSDYGHIVPQKQASHEVSSISLESLCLPAVVQTCADDPSLTEYPARAFGFLLPPVLQAGVIGLNI